MTPRSSTIGYLVYEDLILPVTGVVLRDGSVVFQSTVFSDAYGEISVDDNAECTVVGVDGSQIFWVARTGPPEMLVACNGGRLVLEQKLFITDAERTS